MFKRTIWQQDVAKPNQSSTVMEWLDSLFLDRILALRCLRGDSCAPTLHIAISVSFYALLLVVKALLSMKMWGELRVQADDK